MSGEDGLSRGPSYPFFLGVVLGCAKGCTVLPGLFEDLSLVSKKFFVVIFTAPIIMEEAPILPSTPLCSCPTGFSLEETPNLSTTL